MSFCIAYRACNAVGSAIFCCYYPDSVPAKAFRQALVEACIIACQQTYCLCIHSHLASFTLLAFKFQLGILSIFPQISKLF